MRNKTLNAIAPDKIVVCGDRYKFGKDTIWERDNTGEWHVTGSPAEVEKVEMTITEMSDWSFIQEMVRKRNLLSENPSFDIYPPWERGYLTGLINKHISNVFEVYSHVVDIPRKQVHSFRAKEDR